VVTIPAIAIGAVCHGLTRANLDTFRRSSMSLATIGAFRSMICSALTVPASSS
jgi:hypothetical protein